MLIIKRTIMIVAKIIPLFEETIQLTPLMIKALRTACQKQSNNETFGEIDIEGSFAGLLRRGFIDAKTVIFEGEKMVSWYVTRAGKFSLRKLGFDHNC
jgi:hypothetical protein